MSDEGRGTDEPREGARAASGFAWPMWVNIGWIALGAWHVLAPVNDASGWLGMFQIGVGAFGIIASRRRARRLAEAEAEALPLEEATRIPADVDDERARLDEAAAAHAELDARLRALAMQLEQPGTPGADPDKPEPPHQPTGRGRGRGRKDRAREAWPDDLPPVARW
ncbi:hypothetical protein [Clavibacter michiganensis]|uniref:Uncharacterized protein n=3 Tax=Clavibacter michiganensis TaxID=28447 RepID=A5CU20_CLAM3|nr:hypothetical protein [Clavibacter michiganensis]MDO4024970.1 hypothetical protein [Clavibacter michiganensis]MDO4033628.1 hypothetical protein [Clavibacter michiganensis]MDO4046829.1 hypothetical protein [Clavibacter michiganensis]MDO4106532.1 hypothetical protein [Clavibacter michiganensis]MDO4133551.1 hypothetical protein [Clavibacter michiganensis]